MMEPKVVASALEYTVEGADGHIYGGKAQTESNHL